MVKLKRLAGVARARIYACSGQNEFWWSRRPKSVSDLGGLRCCAGIDTRERILGTRVRIVRRGSKGRVEIDFGSEDELIRIYEQITEAKR